MPDNNQENQNQGQNQNQNQDQNQTEFIQGIVNTALEQANTYQSKNSNNGLNIRNLNLRILDVVLVLMFIIPIVSGVGINYYKIKAYVDSSKPKIEKLEQRLQTLQEFKSETRAKLNECIKKVDRLQVDNKTSRKIALDVSDQVQNIYSNVNNLMNQIDKLERNIEKLEHEN